MKEGEKMKKTSPDIMVVRDLNFFDAKLKRSLGSKGKLAEVTKLSYSSVTHMNTVGVSYGVATRVAEALHANIDELFIAKKPDRAQPTGNGRKVWELLTLYTIHILKS
ncbi:hypothetical protein RYX38_10685 [Lacticaseibacillus rhamnosus]|nr:hypothetical protein [Lacticaseibacillus rhamnosus]